MSTIDKAETPAPSTAVTVKVFRVHIRATAEAIWTAITDPSWNARYGYQAPAEYELRSGGVFRTMPSDAMREHGAGEGPILDGEVLEAEPPLRLVHTWRTLWHPEFATDGFTRVTYEIVDEGNGICTLTVSHDVTGAAKIASLVAGDFPEFGGGWAQTLSDLKTLLETGSPLYS